MTQEDAVMLLKGADNLFIRFMSLAMQDHNPDNTDDPNHTKVVEILTDATLWCEAYRIANNLPSLIDEIFSDEE